MKSSKAVHVLAVVIVLGLVLALTVPGLGSPAVRVWVQYQPGAKAPVQAELARNGAEFHYSFDRLQSLVVSLPEAALRGLRSNPNIVSIEIDPERSLIESRPSAKTVSTDSILPEQVVPYGVDMVQAREIWDANYDGKVDKRAPTGAGVTVCIIDTGLFAGHEEFAGVDIVGGSSQTNDDPGLWTFDGYGHGTHVAGTVAAANNTYGVIGVTPGTASLYSVKFFGDDGLYVVKKHASDLVDAAFICQENGAKIISMSLGGSTRSHHEEMAFDQLYAEGILNIASAGNGASADYSYPASYDSVVSIGGVDEYYALYESSQFNDQVEIAAPAVDVLSTIPFIATDNLVVDGETIAGYHIEYAAYGTASGTLVDGERCLTTGDWAGAVVLCERGDISFYEKVMNVQSSGGAAAVIYNNEPGLFYGTLGEGNSSEIVAISLSQEDGLYLVANKLGLTGTVNSEVVWNVSGYEAWSGTSMAAPHVSGIAAILWSWDASLSNEEIRLALQATAMDLGDPGRDDYFGYGLLQGYDAWIYLGGGKPGQGPK